MKYLPSIVVHAVASSAVVARSHLRALSDGDPPSVPECHAESVVDATSCAAYCDVDTQWGGLWTTRDDAWICVCYAPPAAHVACVADPAAATACDLSGTRYLPLDETPTFDAPAGCQRRCRDADGCAYFNSFPDGSCRLSTGAGGASPPGEDPTSVSGGTSCAVALAGPAPGPPAPGPAPAPPGPAPAPTIPRVPVEADWKHSNGRPAGSYFRFDLAGWADVFGAAVTTGTKVSDVEQWRDGRIVWTGKVKVWPKGSATSGDWPRGRTEPYIARQFRTGDRLSPQPAGRVTVTDAHWTHSNGQPAGTYFRFVLPSWEGTFGALSAGQLHQVDQWRNGVKIWTGDVQVWSEGSKTDWPRGRTEPLTPRHFQTYDQLAPRDDDIPITTGPTIEDTYKGNLGHRGGHDCVKSLPKNSLQSLRAAVHFQESWRYLEVNVRETGDNQLVVFHTSALHDMLPADDHGGNNAAAAQVLADGYDKPYSDLKVAEVTLAELQTLRLNGVPDWVVPTLDEFLDECRSLGVTAPVALEVKELRSSYARNSLLASVALFKEWHGTVVRPRADGDGWDFPSGSDDLVLMGSPQMAYKSFPGGWGATVQERGLRMFEAGNHATELFVSLADTEERAAAVVADVKAHLVGNWTTVSGTEYFTGDGVLTIHPAADGGDQLEFRGHDYGTGDDGLVFIRDTVMNVDGAVLPEINLKRKGIGKNDHIFTMTSETEMSGWMIDHSDTWTLRKVALL